MELGGTDAGVEAIGAGKLAPCGGSVIGFHPDNQDKPRPATELMSIVHSTRCTVGCSDIGAILNAASVTRNHAVARSQSDAPVLIFHPITVRTSAAATLTNGWTRNVSIACSMTVLSERARSYPSFRKVSSKA